MHKVCIDGQETQFSIGQNAWELLKFVAAHQEACSIMILEKYLTSINRTPTDEWSCEN